MQGGYANSASNPLLNVNVILLLAKQKNLSHLGCGRLQCNLIGIGINFKIALRSFSVSTCHCPVDIVQHVLILEERNHILYRV